MHPVVYLDKDRGRISRYESAINPDSKRQRADLSHFGELDLKEGERISEVDWELIQFFRQTPPADMAVSKPDIPTEPQVA